MVLLFVSVTINYLDRSNLSITAPAMRTALGLDTAQFSQSQDQQNQQK